MAHSIRCDRCNDICEARPSTRRVPGHPTLRRKGDLITHRDGTREFREWGCYDTANPMRIVSFDPMA